MNRKLLVIALLLASFVGVQAQITFTVTGKATSDTNGFTQGLDATFTFVAGHFTGDGIWSSFSQNQNHWLEEDTHESPLWTSISGGGLTGAYVRPAGENNPYSGIYVDSGNPTGLSFFISTDSGEGLYVNTPDSAPVAYISGELTGMPTFTFGGTTDFTQYFSAFAGNRPDAGGTLLIQTNTDATQFTVTSVSISAVPEPSTYAMLSGLAALGLVVWRRRAAA